MAEAVMEDEDMVVTKTNAKYKRKIAALKKMANGSDMEILDEDAGADEARCLRRKKQGIRNDGYASQLSGNICYY